MKTSRPSVRTATGETFTTSTGRIVCYQDIFVGIDREITRYARKGGRYLTREDIDDLRQDAFEKAVRCKDSYDPGKCNNNPGIFGYQIAVSCEHDLYRKKQRYASVFVPDEIPDGYSDEFNADYSLESGESVALIRESVDSLEDKQREAVRLRAANVRPQEIAEILGCTSSAVSSRLFRAKEALALKLGSGFLSEFGVDRCA